MCGRASAAALALPFALAAFGCNGDEPASADAGDPDAGALDAASQDAQPLVPCDPVTQEGCEPDQKCSIVPPRFHGQVPVVACVAGTGAQGPFAPCTLATFAVPDDCAPGLVCVGTAFPRCLPFCSDYPEDTCDSGQVCALGEDLDGDWIADVTYCAATCDLFAQDCADPAFACYPTRSGAICAPEGAGDTPAGEGDPCPYANSCAEGLGCFRIGVSAEWLCFKVCDPHGVGGPTCGAGQICNPVEDESWGVCIDEG